MNEAETFLKQAVLFLIVVLAVFLPFRINFSRNYFIVYVFSVLLFCVFYAGLFFGFKIESVWAAVHDIAARVANTKIGPLGLSTPAEEFEKARAQLIEKLNQLGVNKEEILEKIKPLDSQIIHEYSSGLYKKIQKEIRFLSKKETSDGKESIETHNDYLEHFKVDPAQLLNTEGLDEMIAELKQKNIYTEEIKFEINRLKKFLLNSQSIDSLQGAQ